MMTFPHLHSNLLFTNSVTALINALFSHSLPAFLISSKDFVVSKVKASCVIIGP